MDQESLGEEEEEDVEEDGEDGQTDKEKRPKLALTKCKVVPGWHERERMEPSQTNTFFLGLDSQLPARMASRITWSSSILLDFDLLWCDLVLLFVNPPVTLCHRGRNILWSLARVKDVLSLQSLPPQLYLYNS